MAKVTITGIDNLRNQLNKNVTNLAPVMPKVAGLVRAAIDKNFAARGRWDGKGVGPFSGGTQKWKPLASSTKTKYARKGYEMQPTLRRNNDLYASIQITTQGNNIYISSNSRYAQTHQEGATIKHPGGTPYVYLEGGKIAFVSKKKADQRAQAGKKTARTKPHNIVVPPRPFLTLTEQDVDKIVAAISQFALKF